MDLDALISEILKKVQERVAACENDAQIGSGVSADEKKPVLLVLAGDHGEICHPSYTNETLTSCYEMRCALLEENWDVEDCEGVIAYTLTNEALGKIVNGIFDSAYTKAFGKALLSGKKIFIPEEEVELYRYKETAPKGYYKKLEENVEFLKENGVVIVPNDQLICEIMGTECSECSTPEKKEAAPAPAPVAEKIVAHPKRVLSERDLIVAKENGTTQILVSEKTFVTDLAKDYAKKYSIVIKKADGSR